MSERQIFITNYLCNFLPKDMTVIIMKYDYYLEGRSCTFIENNQETSHDEAIYYVGILSDGRIQSCADNEKCIKIWNAQTIKHIETWGLISVYKCSFIKLSDGRTVSVLSNKSTEKFTATEGYGQYILYRHHYNASQIDSTIFFINKCANDDDNILAVWNQQTKQHDIIFTGHTDEISCFVELRNEQDESNIREFRMLRMLRIVSGSYDNTLKIWNLGTRSCDLTLKGHTDKVLCVAILPDGRIISGSSDKTLKVWNPKTGNCDVTFVGHNDSVNCVIVLSDGRIISGSSDKTLKLWY